jgi:hypothetical protein
MRGAKRCLAGVATVAAGVALVVTVAEPARAATVDVHIGTFDDSTGPGLVNICLTIKPSPASCLNIG